MHPRSRPCPLAAGFVLLELAAAAAVVVVLGALVVAWSSETRRQASLGDDLANLKQFAFGTGAYAADNDDRVWGFSWQRNVNYGFGGFASTDLAAQSNQAIEIIRRRADRPDILPIQGWFPHAMYSHLVLLDYFGSHPLERFVVAPGDWQRLLWQSSITTDVGGYFDLIPGVERPPGFSGSDKRWSYSSSYDLAPAFYSADALRNGVQTVAQGANYGQWNVPPAARLGGRRLSEVAFPSQKVMMHERYQRHFGPRQVLFMYQEARVPVKFVDGSVAVRTTGDANLGFIPNSPFNGAPARFPYVPGSWEPPTLNGGSEQLVIGHYRWTRSGLRGRDFGGPEVPWVD